MGLENLQATLIRLRDAAKKDRDKAIVAGNQSRKQYHVGRVHAFEDALNELTAYEYRENS